jgi:hypothetical protein
MPSPAAMSATFALQCPRTTAWECCTFCSSVDVSSIAYLHQQGWFACCYTCITKSPQTFQCGKFLSILDRQLSISFLETRKKLYCTLLVLGTDLYWSSRLYPRLTWHSPTTTEPHSQLVTGWPWSTAWQSIRRDANNKTKMYQYCPYYLNFIRIYISDNDRFYNNSLALSVYNSV